MKLLYIIFYIFFLTNIYYILDTFNTSNQKSLSSINDILKHPILFKNNVKCNSDSGINLKLTLRKKDGNDINLVVPYSGFIFIVDADSFYKIEIDTYGNYKSIIYHISNSSSLKIHNLINDNLSNIDDSIIQSILKNEKYMVVNLYNSFFVQSNNSYISEPTNDIICEAKITIDDASKILKLDDSTISKFRDRDKKRKEKLKKHNNSVLNLNIIDTEIYNLKDIFTFYRAFFNIVFPGLLNRGNMSSYYGTINFIMSKITFNMVFKDISNENISRYLLNLEDQYSNLDLQYSYKSILSYWDTIKNFTDKEDYEAHEAIDLVKKILEYSYLLLNKEQVS
jgi:hypothetical protein